MSITILLKQMYFKMNTLIEKEKLQNCEFAHRGFVKWPALINEESLDSGRIINQHKLKLTYVKKIFYVLQYFKY